MKKNVCLLFCIVLIISAPVNVYATSAGSVVVAGGSVLAGGLAPGYGAKMEKTAITLTMALLYSMGVTVHLTQEAIEAGQSAYGYVQSLFSEWVSGTSAEQMSASDREELKRRFSVINGGGNIDPTGNIFLNGTALDLFRRFVNWCKQTGKIGDSSTSDDPYETGSINGIFTIYSSELRDPNSNVFFITSHTKYSANQSVSVITDPVNVLWYKFYGGSYVHRVAVSTVDNNIYVHRCQGNNITNSGQHLLEKRNGYTAYGFWANRNQASMYPDAAFANDASYTGSIDSAYATFFNGGDGTLGIEGSGNNTLPDGLVHDGDVDTSVLDNPDNNQTVINPGLLPTIADDNPGKEYQVSADDYLEAIRQILNQKTNPADVPEQLPVTDVPTGVTVPVDIPADQPADWPITTPSSPTATPDVPTGSTPVVDPTQTPEPTDTIKLLKVDLTKIFPFCIPWDIYNLLNKFVADPVTPSIDWDWGDILGFLGVNTVMHLDLHDYDGVAEILRNMETVAFVIGLAYATKKVFVK